MPYKQAEDKKNNAHRYYTRNRKLFPDKWRMKFDYQKEYKRQIRLLAIAAYGGKCVCCGEAEPKFLCFDHRDGGGGKMRKENKKLTGNGWYNHLLRAHPEDIRLLCHNCNMALGLYGICPHVENKQQETLVKLIGEKN